MAVAMPSLVPRDDISLVPSSRSESLQVATSIANAALQIIDSVKQFDFKSLLSLQVPSISPSPFDFSQSLQVRIGLHCGPVTAGVLGTERLQYDVWGDTVNVASRMESTSEPNRIHITEQFAKSLSPLSAKERGLGESSLEMGESSLEFELIERGMIEVKGKGPMQTFWLEAT